MSYSTGEIAELCGVSVRCVQYYDREGLLKPESISEGGRMLYGEESLRRLQIICMYKQLGLGLAEIREILSDETNCRNVLLRVLETRERELEEELREKLSQRDGIQAIRHEIAEGRAISRNSFFDVRKIMTGKKETEGDLCGAACRGTDRGRGNRYDRGFMGRLRLVDSVCRRVALRSCVGGGRHRICVSQSCLCVHGLRKEIPSAFRKVYLFGAHAQNAQACLSALRREQLSYRNVFGLKKV